MKNKSGSGTAWLTPGDKTIFDDGGLYKWKKPSQKKVTKVSLVQTLKYPKWVLITALIRTIFNWILPHSHCFCSHFFLIFHILNLYLCLILVFQIFPKYFKIFRIFPKYSEFFQNIPNLSKNIPNFSKIFQNIPKYSKSFQKYSDFDEEKKSSFEPNLDLKDTFLCIIFHCAF